MKDGHRYAVRGRVPDFVSGNNSQRPTANSPQSPLGCLSSRRQTLLLDCFSVFSAGHPVEGHNVEDEHHLASSCVSVYSPVDTSGLSLGLFRRTSTRGPQRGRRTSPSLLLRVCSLVDRRFLWVLSRSFPQKIPSTAASPAFLDFPGALALTQTGQLDVCTRDRSTGIILARRPLSPCKSQREGLNASFI